MPHSRKRRGHRIQTRLKALYATREESGDAMLVEISYSGARLENTGARPTRGTPISVYVWLENQEEPFELVGRVARRRPDGFAIEYEKPGQTICQMVDLAAAAVGSGAAEGSAPEEPRAPAPGPARWRPRPLAELELSAYELLELEDHAARVAEEIARRRLALKRRLAAEKAGGD